MLRLFLFTIGLKYNKCTFYWKCRIQASIILASIFVLYKLHLKPTSFSVTKTVFCSMYSSPRSPSWKTTSVSLTTVVLVRERKMTSRSMLGLGQEVQCPPFIKILNRTSWLRWLEESTFVCIPLRTPRNSTLTNCSSYTTLVRWRWRVQTWCDSQSLWRLPT